jgi:hypothetical protein
MFSPKLMAHIGQAMMESTKPRNVFCNAVTGWAWMKTLLHTSDLGIFANFVIVIIICYQHHFCLCHNQMNLLNGYMLVSLAHKNIRKRQKVYFVHD